MSPLPFVNRASWIWSAEGTHEVPPAGARSASHYEVRRFRRTFTLAALPEGEAPLHVTADSRFLLYCNGRLVGRGPAKGDINHHFFDTIDLRPYLRVGANALSALVLDFSHVAHRPAWLGAPCSVMTYAGGFLAEGAIPQAGGTEVRLDTGLPGWRVAVDRAYRFQNDNTTYEGYHGYFEHRVDAELPSGWTGTEFDDGAWPEATVLYVAERLENRRDPTSPYGLLARMIPPLVEGEEKRFAAVFASGGGEVAPEWHDCRAGAGAVTLAPGTQLELIFDAGELTSAYPLLRVRGGRGAHLRLTYAEALRLPWGTPGARLLGQQQSLQNLASHFADEASGWTFDRRGVIRGWSDRWEPAGGEEATFEPLHWRSFRFLGLKIEVGDEPLTVLSIGHRFTAYPYTFQAEFACSDPQLARLWKMGLRTAQLCSHETFEDCPHYEQMQYAGDTMITSKIAMLTTGDYRLTRQALFHFDWSRLSDGLTQSRFPSRLVQVIPSWSLHWITAIRDYAYCSGDLRTVEELLPGVRTVLEWFERHRDASGLPARLPYWNITDWCPWWPRGVVPGADTGPTCIIAAQFILALDEAADLHQLTGDRACARRLSRLAERLRTRLHATFWSDKEGLYFDRPGGPELSQYGNAWAIVCGAADETTRRRMLERFPHDERLAPGSFFCGHTVFRALAMADDYSRVTEMLGPWHESAAAGLDTFVEENSYWRSLCHAWSAHPVLEFLTRVVGISPARPGFAEVSVAPLPTRLSSARGSVCTPSGPVSASWEKQGSQFSFEVRAPRGIPVTVHSPNGALHRFDGGEWKGTLE